MPWWGLVYNERNIKESAAKLHGCTGIPMLVCMKSNGKIVSKNFRSDISSRGSDALNDLNWLIINLLL